MRLPLRTGAVLGALVLFLSACADSDVSGPELPVEVGPPSLAIFDGSTFGSDAFYFLPPIVEGTPTILGTFNPDLLPAVRVCELTALLGDCVAGPPVVEFPAGSVPVGSGKYSLSWDTDGPETGAMDSDHFYRLEVVLGDRVVGWIELDPQAPDGPGQSLVDAFAFRLGETLPVQFWLGVQVLCEPTAYVTECITGAVVDESGAELSLDGEGNKLGVVVYEGGLPGADHPPVTVTLERIDAARFFAETGEECIPFFDAPQFADCFRVTTSPVLTEPLDFPALVSICMDPTVLAGIDLSEEQQDQLTMVRFDDEEWEALPDAPGDCPTVTAALLPVPERGVLRYAALGMNAVARFLGPQPLSATDIRLGGFTSSFSRFRYALPGQVVAVEGDGVVLQAGDPSEVAAAVRVVDHEGFPVEGATVHFSTDDGAVSAADVTTGADGRASTTWTVDRSTAGPKSLSAAGLGLLPHPVPEHSAAYLFPATSIELVASVVGVPTDITASPEAEISGTAGTSAGPVQVTVTDAGGLPVVGLAVAWGGDGTVIGGEATGAGGTATGEWILPETAGSATLTATAGALSTTFTAAVSPGAAATLATSGAGGSSPVGSTIPISVTVTDAFGNVRTGDAVAWSVTGGGGSIDGSTTTEAEGSASASWTLGTAPGLNTARVSVGALSADFTAEGACRPNFGAAVVDGTFGAGEWACARSLAFDANVSGGSTPASVYWMSDDSNLYLAVRVRQASISQANDVRFDFDNDADGIVEVGDDVIGIESDPLVFFDESLDQRCVNRNQSGCSVAGESIDGAGAIGNDGTWTVFELSHPLDGGDPADFSLRPGDRTGFFLTLRLGNGAQGNTQVPGFRSYAEIVIAGS